MDPCPLGSRFFLFLYSQQRCKRPGERPQPALTGSCPNNISELDTGTLTDSLWYVKAKPMEFNSQASKIHMWYSRLPITPGEIISLPMS